MLSKAFSNFAPLPLRGFSTAFKSGMNAPGFDSGFPKHKEMFNDAYYSQEQTEEQPSPFS